MSEEPAKKKGRTGLIIAAAFLAVVLVGGTSVLGWRALSEPEPDPNASPGPSATAEPSVPTATGTGGQCPELDAPERDDTQPLTDVTYEPLPNGRSVVISQEYGPAVRDADGVYRCYDHSPTGALLAMINYLKQTSNQPALIYDPRLMLDGPERQILEMQGPTDQSGAGRIVGFRVHNSSKSDADSPLVIPSLLLVGPKGNHAAVTMSLTWKRGDWKVVPAPDTADYLITETSPDLSSFSLWEPQP